MIVTRPNFFTRTAYSMKGIPVMSVQSAPSTGRKTGTKPMGIATQQPSTKYSTVKRPRLIRSFA